MQLSEFDSGLLGRWLHALLVSFYNDEEAVIVNLLYQRKAWLPGASIANALGIPEQRVRKNLESRLVPDCLVERQVLEESTVTGVPHKYNYYRLSPICVAIAARRLQTFEDSLANTVTDGFRCIACGRYQDSLQAMAEGFKCGVCKGELRSVGEEARERRGMLLRFRSKCHDLLQLTRQIKDMPMPQFGMEQREKTSSAGVARADDSSTASTAVSTTLPQNEAVENAPRQGVKEAVPDWFRREILGRDVSMDVAVDSRTEAGQEVHNDRDLQAARSLLREEHGRHYIGFPNQTSPSVSAIGSKVPQEAELMVMVKGEPVALPRARRDAALLDQMTDEEYRRFFDLERSRLKRERIALLTGRTC